MSLTNSPLCLSDQTAGSSLPCLSPHQYKLQGQLFTGRLLSSPLLSSPLLPFPLLYSPLLSSSLLSSPLPPFFSFTFPLPSPDWTNHWAIRRWSILEENRFFYHRANDCDVLSLILAVIKVLGRFTVLRQSPLFSPPFFFIHHKGRPPRQHFLLPQGCNSQQEVSCGFPVHFPWQFYVFSVMWTFSSSWRILLNCLFQTEMTEIYQGFIYCSFFIYIYIYIYTSMVDIRYTPSAAPSSARPCCCEMSFCLGLLREMVWSGGSDAAADYTEIRRLTSNLPSAVWGSISQLE